MIPGPESTPAASFDQYSDGYSADLDQGLSLTGESVGYYARGRIRRLAERLARLGCRVRSVLDFGCGVGNSIPLLLESLGAEEVVGFDVSPASLAIARDNNRSPRVRCVLPGEFEPEASFDLAFCNGVFHHIAPEKRADALTLIRDALRPGGLFAFCENNPWNPGTRIVMNRVAFDRNAIMLTAGEARRLLQGCGFEILEIGYLFIFPRRLKWFRFLEPLASPLPLGGQYMVLCRKPAPRGVTDRPLDHLIS